MEAIFEALKKLGKNDVSTLTEWIKSTGILGNDAKVEKAKQMLTGANPKSVEVGKFKEVVSKIATEEKQDVAAVNKKLADEGAKMVQALQGQGAKEGVGNALRGLMK